MLSIKNSDWVGVQDIKVRHNNTWKSPQSNWIKVDGTWRQLIPNNAVILYDTTDHNGLLADGTHGTYNLINRHVQLTETPLQQSGVASHGSHGGGSPIPFLYDKGSRKVDGWNFFNWSEYLRNSSSWTHWHSIPTHTHTGVVENFPPSRYLRPVMYGSMIDTDAVFLANTEISYAQFTKIIYNMYLYLSETVNYVRGTPTHTHGSVNPGTSGGSGASADALACNDNRTLRNSAVAHTHSTIHTDPPGQSMVNYRAVYTYKTNAPMYFDQLPIGTIVLFTSTIIPPGYTVLSGIADGRYVFMKDENTWADDYNSNPDQTPFGHNHGQSIVGTSGLSNNCIYTRALLSSSTECIAADHNHNIYDYHGDYKDQRPLSVSLYAAVKTSF